MGTRGFCTTQGGMGLTSVRRREGGDLAVVDGLARGMAAAVVGLLR